MRLSFSCPNFIVRPRTSIRSHICPSVGLSVYCANVKIAQNCRSWRPFLGSGSEGVDDLCFHIRWEFSPPPSPSAPPPHSNPSLKAQIPVSKPKSLSQSPNLSPMAEIQRETEKIPHMCESIGHRPLLGRCPASSLNFKHNLPGRGYR